MLDKQIPYKNIVMQLDSRLLDSLSAPVLPEGYRFRLYRDGDALHWARIETSVLEFETKAEAYRHFTGTYLPRSGELTQRCIFVLNPKGLPIATATAWYDNSDLGHQANLHWVAVCPQEQGRGIGEAIVRRALQIYKTLEPREDILLHTQTWSHSAVCLYHKLGFVMMKAKTIKGCGNEYEEAMDVLRTVLPEPIYLSLRRTAQ